jgi:hypothetical protein
MKTRALLLSLFALLALAACGSDDGGNATASASASGSTASTGCEVVDGTNAARDAEVHATLDEWKITADPDTVDAGIVEFDAKNDGEHDHELVVVKGATPDELTIGPSGLDEKALPAGAEVLGEIEGFPAGTSCHAKFELAAGDYSLVCNITDTTNGSHAKHGMVTAFTVK